MKNQIKLKSTVKKIGERIKQFLPLILFIWKPSDGKSQQQTKAQSSPNVLFIIVDDLKPILGCYGDKMVKSPNIDRLASRGMIFANGHCQEAVCAPTRASLFTGMRPDYTQIWDLKTLIRDKNPGIVTMPQFFKSQGYLTAATGKVFDSRSVDKLHDSISWSFPYQKIERDRPNGGGYVFAKERLCVEMPDVPDSVMMDAEVTRQSKTLIDKMAVSGKPFFLAVGYHRPHLPFVAPKKYWDMYDRSKIQIHPFQQFAKGTPEWVYQPGWELRNQYTDTPKSGPIPEELQKKLIHGYYACVSFIDQQIGEITGYLEEKGLDKNTVIVLVGDHGWHLGDHSVWCKHTTLEQATRSPLIIAGPGCPKGIKTEVPVEFVDVFPTLCDLTSQHGNLPLQGKTLLPVMKHPAKPIKEFAVSQFPRNDTLMGYAFRDARYRYVVWLKHKFTTNMPYNPSLVVARELYDYKTDPYETVNLTTDNSYKPVVKRFEKSILDFMNEEYRFLSAKKGNDLPQKVSQGKPIQ